MNFRIMNDGACRKVYGIIVSSGGASPSDYALEGSFTFAHTRPFQVPSEFPLIEKLGFGGAFRVDSSGRMFVDRHPGDMNDERRQIIEAINNALHGYEAIHVAMQFGAIPEEAR